MRKINFERPCISRLTLGFLLWGSSAQRSADRDIWHQGHRLNHAADDALMFRNYMVQFTLLRETSRAKTARLALCQSTDTRHATREPSAGQETTYTSSVGDLAGAMRSINRGRGLHRRKATNKPTVYKVSRHQGRPERSGTVFALRGGLNSSGWASRRSRT